MEAAHFYKHAVPTGLKSEGLRVCKVSAENPVRLQTAPTGFGTEAIIFLKLTPMVRFQTAPTGL